MEETGILIATIYEVNILCLHILETMINASCITVLSRGITFLSLCLFLPLSTPLAFIAVLIFVRCRGVSNPDMVWRSGYSDVIMSTMASQFIGFSIVYSIVCSGADQRKHQSSASLAFVRGIYRWPAQGASKIFAFDDVTMWHLKGCAVLLLSCLSKCWSIKAHLIQMLGSEKKWETQEASFKTTTKRDPQLFSIMVQE